MAHFNFVDIYLKSPVYNILLSPCSNRNITDPGQWPAGIAVTDVRSIDFSSVESSFELLNDIGVGSENIVSLVFSP